MKATCYVKLVGVVILAGKKPQHLCLFDPGGFKNHLRAVCARPCPKSVSSPGGTKEPSGIHGAQARSMESRWRLGNFQRLRHKLKQQASNARGDRACACT